MVQTDSIILTQRLSMFFHYQNLKMNLILNFFMEKKFVLQHMNTFCVNNKKLIQFSVIDCILLGILLLHVNLREESPR